MRLARLVVGLAACAQALSSTTKTKVSRRGLAKRVSVGLVGVLFPRRAVGLEREFSNSNVLFKDDFWYKFGKKPAPLSEDTELPGTPVFVRTQVRYEALGKYGPKINVGLAAFKSLQDGDLESAQTVLLALRPMGLLANSLLATESLTNEVFLARYYINEIYLCLVDLDAVRRRSPADADQAIINARKYINSFLILVNRAIIPKVGEKFVLL